MLKIILFTNDKQPTPKFPIRNDVEFKHVEFYSSKLEDLTYVAKFRVLKFPTSLVLNGNNKVLFRVQGMIDNETITELINA